MIDYSKVSSKDKFA